MQVIRAGNRADFFTDPFDQFKAQFFGWFLVSIKGDIGIDALTLDVVRNANHGGLGHFGMGN